jgi:hypothetical protein
MADITPARKLFDLLVSRDFDPEMLDSSGKPAPDPAEAEIFSFDFRAHSGKDYGTVVIMLGDDNDLEIYCSDNVGRSMEGTDKNDWFAFLEQLKQFAVRNFMTFGIKNLNRLRYSMQGQAAIKEGLFESWTGNRTTSWNGAPTEARLMIRHKKNISEGDARFRYIESLFIETADSERYKLPFKSLTGGRAMLEHVRQGGRPYDARGNHIAEMVTELNVLSRFRRANQGQIFEGDTQQLVEQVQEYQANLQRGLKGLGTQTGYTKYFESWSPADISEQDVVIESLKSLFVKQSIDTRIESALPLLAKIQQQGTAMKEANIFEAWAERLTEGTWQTPDTPEKQAKLLELMSTDLPVGADATNATEQLYDLLGDDELFDQLEALAEQDANADARQVVFDRMQQLSNDPDVLKVIEQLNIDPTAEMNPPEATNPADLTEEELDELSRRDFLKGAGAALGGAALAGVAGAANANPVVEPSPGTLQALIQQAQKVVLNHGEGMKAWQIQQLQSDIERAAKPILDADSQKLARASLSNLQMIFNQLYREETGRWPVDFNKYLKESRLMDDTGQTWDHIMNRFKHEVKKFEEGNELDDDLYHALFDYWNDAGEIPYGVQKARDGDPYEWVAQNLESHLSGGGIVGGNPDEDYGLERESVMHGDYAEEKSRMRELAGIQDEGIIGSVLGGLAGSVLGGPNGSKIGSMLGSKIGDAMSSTDTNEAVGSHDGKPTVEYRGMFYAKQPNGSWASLKGDHVVEPAVKQVLDKMHTANEAIIDPNSTVAIHDPEGERFVDPKADADVNVAAKWADIAHAGDVGPQPGVHAWAAGYPNTNNKNVDIKGNMTPATATPAPTTGGIKQQPAKDMGKADVIDVEEGDDIDIDAKFANPQDQYGNPAKNSLGQTADDIRAQAGLERVRQAAGLRPTLTPTGPYDTKKLGGPDMQPALAREDESPLKGQYGHSGKLKSVDKDLSFLDRLKELSGMKK